MCVTLRDKGNDHAQSAGVLRLYPPHDGSLIGLPQSRVAVAASRPCLVFEGHSHTYAQVLEAAARTAAVLAARGVGAGDRVAVMSHNHPSTVFLLLALASLGAVMVPINLDYGVAEAHYVLGHAEGVRRGLLGRGLGPTVEQACAGLQQRPWCLLNAAPADARRQKTPGGIELLDDLLRQQKAVTPLVPAQAADVTGLFIYTSGTTGFPKGVMHSQRTLVAAGECFVARMHLQPEDRLLCVLPLFHINAIFYSLAGALGGRRHLDPGPPGFPHRASGAWCTRPVPPRSTPLRPPPASCCAARVQRVPPRPCAEEDLRRPLRCRDLPRLPAEPGVDAHRRLRHAWRSLACSATPSTARTAWAAWAGPVPIPIPAPLAEPRIADDSGRLAPGEVGELVVRTPLLMQGYYRDPEQTAAAFRDGWFRTGDLAWVDGEGYFWFVARQKDIIRRRGENISRRTDRVVGSHPAVMEAAAIAVPSELGEDDILVAVVLRPGQQASAEQIGAWCRERLAAAKVPRYVAWVDSLPHTPTHRGEVQAARNAGCAARPGGGPGGGCRREAKGSHPQEALHLCHRARRVFSSCGTWPRSSNTTSFEPPMSRAKRSPNSSGISRSRPPHRISGHLQPAQCLGVAGVALLHPASSALRLPARRVMS